MKKIYPLLRTTVVALALLCCSSYADAQRVQLVEGELGAGYGMSIGSFHGSKMRGNFEFNAELRFNIPGRGFDVGLAYNISNSTRLFEENHNGVGVEWDQHNRSHNVLVMGDYNFRQGTKYNPYVGTGIGVSIQETHKAELYPCNGTGVMWRTRAGIELWRHVRVGVFLNIGRAGWNTFGVSIGGVIGGRPK